MLGIRRDQIDLSGDQTIETLLSQGSQFLGSQTNSSTGNTVPGGSVALNLRGLGEQRNLVLVNGRRFAIAGIDQTTDLNAIPPGLVDRIEVVTGGSSAVYGSDAISGVVNFIMKTDLKGVDLSARTDWDEPTGRRTHEIELTVGRAFAEDRGIVMVAVNATDRDAITRGEMGGWAYFAAGDGCVTKESWSASRPGQALAVPTGQTCTEAGGRPGLIATGSGDLPNGRFFGIPQYGAVRSSPQLDMSLTAAGLQSAGGRGFTFDDAGMTARPALTPEDDYNNSPPNYLIIPLKRRTANAFFTFQVTSADTAYAELHASQNTTRMQFAPTNINGTFLLETTNPFLSSEMKAVFREIDALETTTTTINQGGIDFTNRPQDGLIAIGIGRRMAEIPVRRNVSERRLARGVVGIRGSRYGLQYDVYYSYAKMRNRDRQTGAVSRSRFALGLLSHNGQPPVLNIFGANISPTAAQSVTFGSTNYQYAAQDVFAGNVRGSGPTLRTGRIVYSLGFEWRRNTAILKPDYPADLGDIAGFTALRPTSGSVSVKEVYGEVRLPLIANQRHIGRLDMTAALRYSDYSLAGVGGVWSYSAGLQWQPSADFSVRSQLQHSIRAPSIGELYNQQSAIFTPAVDPCSSRAAADHKTDAVRKLCIQTGVPDHAVFTELVQPNGIIGVTSGGNPLVGQEESDTLTFGATYQPTHRPTAVMSVDFFDIRVDGAIGSGGGGLQSTLNLCYYEFVAAENTYCQAIHRDRLTGEISQPTYVQTTNANAGGLRVSGVDLSLRDTLSASGYLSRLIGTVEVAVDATYTQRFTINPVQALSHFNNECVGAFGGTCGQPVPRWKSVSTLTWRGEAKSVSLKVRYIGEVWRDSYRLPRRAGGNVPDLENMTSPRIAPQVYVDLSIMLKLGQRTSLFGGVTNVMNREPPIPGSAQYLSNTWPATYDVLGRTFQVALKTTF
ncbi:TonB-dependent receptor [Asticcacaulis sp. BYS171W]|uniref:TonB-dependent receptor n=1 Tax=Asticcacaulis aquaticus TaxID=2984212 RepID=A0ABT5HQ56_9CAUL|nr:TonB-dependent receptor [Asticcacaulis aquaticus]MDC7682119.1 TonB-dependent receptor [Asticcacaulis aquaticus]